MTYDESIDGWNRSQIMEYDLANDTVNVFFVDLNSWEENVSRSRIRFILTKYSSRPVRLLTCRLAAVAALNSSNQWDEVSSNTFQNVIDKCRCDVEPLYQRCDQMFYVNLFAAHDEAYVCVNDFLIHCKMAKPAEDNLMEESAVRTRNVKRRRNEVYFDEDLYAWQGWASNAFDDGILLESRRVSSEENRSLVVVPTESNIRSVVERALLFLFLVDQHRQLKALVKTKKTSVSRSSRLDHCQRIIRL